jgi:putative spermidine/putrescine transport system substrate-binding protein
MMPKRRLCLSFLIASFAVGTPLAHALAQDNTVVLAQFGGVWQQVLEKALVPFETEQKVKIRYVPGSSMDSAARAIASRNNPDVDVVLGEELSFGMAREEKIWEKLDPAKVPNLNVIVPQARFPNDEGVGIVMQSVGMFYRTDTFQKNNWAAPTSWFDILDKKYCRRLGISHPNVSFTHYALMMLGGGKPDDYPTGVNRLAEHRDCIETMDPSAQKTLEKVQLGEYDLGVSTSILIITLQKRGVPVRFFNPKEGAMLQFTTAAVIKNAPHPALAQALVNELLSPRVQRMLVEQFNGSPVNPTVPPRADLIEAGSPNPTNLTGFKAIEADAILTNRKRYIQEAVRALGR